MARPDQTERKQAFTDKLAAPWRDLVQFAPNIARLSFLAKMQYPGFKPGGGYLQTVSDTVPNMLLQPQEVIEQRWGAAVRNGMSLADTAQEAEFIEALQYVADRVGIRQAHLILPGAIINPSLAAQRALLEGLATREQETKGRVQVRYVPLDLPAENMTVVRRSPHHPILGVYTYDDQGAGNTTERFLTGRTPVEAVDRYNALAAIALDGPQSAAFFAEQAAAS